MTYQMLALVQTLIMHYGYCERLDRLEDYLMRRMLRDE